MTASKQAVDEALLAMEERERCGLPGTRPLSVNEIMQLHVISEERLREKIADVEAEKQQLLSDWAVDSDRAAAREAQMSRRSHWLHLILFGAAMLIAYLVAR